MMVDVNDIVRDTLALRAYEPRAGDISMVEELAPALPEVFADGHQVKQVMLNLVINAEQAMLEAHGGGALTVRTVTTPRASRWCSKSPTTVPAFPTRRRARSSIRSSRPRTSGRARGSG